ncbi:MAG: alpha/beta fold hydrolase, partial [Gaiellales bacterium]
DGTWPYAPRWLFTGGVRIHYVDEGPRSGPPVVMLHGNPTWSYLYRRLIAALAEAGFRAIAYDAAGFGRSDKPRRASEYSLRAHSQHFHALMKALSLRQATLVMHGWGGPIGLSWAVDYPGRVAALVPMNTFTGLAPDGLRLPVAVRLAGGPGSGELIVKGAHAVVRRGLFGRGMEHPERLGAAERKAYLAPHPSWESRTGVLASLRLMSRSGGGPTAEIGTRIESGLSSFFDTPTLICWGMRDKLAEPMLRYWRQALPAADVCEIDDAGHFLQEDAPEEVSRAVLGFLGRVTSPSGPRGPRSGEAR